MADLFDIERAVKSVVTAVEGVEKAVGRVEEAVKNRAFSLTSIIWSLTIPALMVVTGQIWHSELRYKIQYSLDSVPLVFEKEPHDCEFLSAPLGEKHCDYDQIAVKIEWATSATGGPIESLDDGRTWNPFVPESNAIVPKDPTLERIVVMWKKEEE